LPIVDYRAEQTTKFRRAWTLRFLSGAKNCCGKRPPFIFTLILSDPMISKTFVDFANALNFVKLSNTS